MQSLKNRIRNMQQLNFSNAGDKTDYKLSQPDGSNFVALLLSKTIQKHPVLTIVVTWTAAQLISWVIFGIVTELEGLKYIHAADYLLQNGSFPETRYWFYSVTTGLIALSKLLHTGYWPVFFLQLTYSLTAHLVFYKSLKSLSTEQDQAPLLTTLLLCCILPYQRWNLTLYTESVFYSSVLLFFASCILFQKISFKNSTIQLLLLLLVILSRPLGILLLIPWIVYLFLRSPAGYRLYFLILIAAGGIILLTVSNLILSSIGDWNILAPFQEGYIICDLSSSDTIKLHSNPEATPLQQLFLYLQQHPGHFLRMSFKKTAAFFLLVRPYYSTFHNLALYLLAGLLYLPVLIVLLKKKFNTLSITALSIVLIVWSAVILQCDDYHSRFHLMLIPIFLFLGVFRLLQSRTHE